MNEENPKQASPGQEEPSPKVVYKVIRRDIKEKYTFLELLGYLFWAILSGLSLMVSLSSLDELQEAPYFLGYLMIIALSFIALTNSFNYIRGSLAMPPLPGKIALIALLIGIAVLGLLFRNQIVSFTVAKLSFLVIRTQ